MIKRAIEKLINKEKLTFEEAFNAMGSILDQQASSVQSAAFLAALSSQNADIQSVEEIAGCADAVRSRMTRVDCGKDVLEIVGTGGDGSSSFNISTTSAFVAAAAGVKVAKHGDRAASSKSGTADCLEALGADISLSPEACLKVLEESGFCFFFAQKYHPALEYISDMCREMGSRTILNLLGSLTNPASPSYYLMGVYEEDLVEPVARVLVRLGVKRGLVIFGKDRMDEISMSGTTCVCEIRDGFYRSYEIRPEDFGFRRCSREELVGGTPEVNAGITRDILNGTETGAKRNIVLLNAGAAIYAANAADSIAGGIRIAESCINNGSARAVMERFIALSRQ